MMDQFEKHLREYNKTLSDLGLHHMLSEKEKMVAREFWQEATKQATATERAKSDRLERKYIKTCAHRDYLLKICSEHGFYALDKHEFKQRQLADRIEKEK